MEKKPIENLSINELKRILKVHSLDKDKTVLKWHQIDKLCKRIVQFVIGDYIWENDLRFLIERMSEEQIAKYFAEISYTDTMLNRLENAMYKCISTDKRPLLWTKCILAKRNKKYQSIFLERILPGYVSPEILPKIMELFIVDFHCLQKVYEIITKYDNSKYMCSKLTKESYKVLAEAMTSKKKTNLVLKIAKNALPGCTERYQCAEILIESLIKKSKDFPKKEIVQLTFFNPYIANCDTIMDQGIENVVGLYLDLLKNKKIQDFEPDFGYFKHGLT